MAIDMLESTENGTFADSRLGNKCFIDDDNYSNLFGSKKAKRNAAKVAAAIGSEYAIPADKRKDCKWLNDKLIQASNQYEAVLSKGLKKRLVLRETRPLLDAIAGLKTALQQNGCEESAAVAEQEKATQKTIEEINKAAKDTPLQEEGAEGESADVSDTSNRNKYIIYGVGGLLALVLIVAIVRKAA